MSWLFIGDPHLTDSPADEYRWRMFDNMRDIVKHNAISRIVIAGDLCDRKDRHSGVLVNRIIEELSSFFEPIDVLCGNHDRALDTIPYFTFLSMLKNVRFITQPTPDKSALFLPWSPNPLEEWADLTLSQYKVIFIHQTITGVVEGGYRAENNKMPILPRGVKVYGGDIHTQQTVGTVVYVGAPHPIKYGDDYKCRALLLNETTFAIEKEISLETIQKVMLDIRSIDDLKHCKVKEGDQAHIRVSLTSEQLSQWGEFEAEITKWARTIGVRVNAVEASLDYRHSGSAPEEIETFLPKDVLVAFAEEEGITGKLLDVGLTLLEEIKAE